MNAVVFALLYIVLMLPTYVLPYLGSNSGALNAAGAASGAGLNPLFWVHLIAFALLIAITWSRGAKIDRAWLVIFPVLAAIFDLIPGLNWIPMIPTVMHLLAIILGVALSPRPATVSGAAA